LRFSASQDGDNDQAAAQFEQLHIAREVVGAGNVEDDIDPVRMDEHGLGKILLLVVDGESGAQLKATRDLGVGTGGGDHFATGLVAKLDGRGADSRGAAVNKRCFALLQLGFDKDVGEGGEEDLSDGRPPDEVAVVG